MIADPSPFLAWLLTYWLHSTLLLGALVLTAPLWRRRSSDATQEALWKLGLVGALLSATLQTGLGLQTLGGRLALTPAAQETVAPDGPTDPLEGSALSALRSASPTPYPTRDHTEPDPGRSGGGDASLRSPASPSFFEVLADADAPVAAPPAAEVTAAGRGLPWEGLGIALAMLIALGPLVLAWRRTRAHLAGRTPLTSGPLRERLDRLCASAGVRRRVRLSSSEQLAAPIAMGMLHWEICVPPRALESLRPAQQEAMLAHELAHLVRGDSAWLAFCRGLEVLFFLQPLNRVARRRLQALFELRADSWAASHTGDSLGLARCLTEVAEWLMPASPMTEGYSSMAGQPSQLACRVQRLLSDQHREPERRRLPILLAATLLAPLSIAAPSVSTAARAAAVERVAPAHRIDSGGPPPATLEESVSALEAELEALMHEIAGLRESVQRLPEETDLLPLMEHLEERARSLRDRRNQLSPH